mmetsp:Transcript_18038/g.23428  ORF Transcript_18038/g.23428 Transcript_18038/m.23428 type:complete len:81 (-) Transcript_18038:9-251(-)
MLSCSITFGGYATSLLMCEMAQEMQQWKQERKQMETMKQQRKAFAQRKQDSSSETEYDDPDLLNKVAARSKRLLRLNSPC